MVGSEEDNSIVDTTDIREEADDIDTTNSGVDIEQASEEDTFSSGLLDVISGDGLYDETSGNSKEDIEDTHKQEEQAEDIPANQVEVPKNRPDKRQRELEILKNELAERDMALAEFRTKEMEANRVKPPEPDEDGNITLDGLMSWIEQRDKERTADIESKFEQQLSEAKAKEEYTRVTADIDREINSLVGKYQVLDNANPSYDPKIHATVLDRVEMALQSYLVGGRRDYTGMLDTVVDTIDSIMTIYTDAQNVATKNNSNSLNALRSSSALTSSESGSDDSEDGFSKGLLSVI